MKSAINASRLVIILVFTAAVIGFSAFRQKDSTAKKSFRDGYTKGSDTTTRGKRNRLENEYHLEQLERSLQILDKQLVELDEQQLPDLKAMKIKLDEQLKKIDFEKMDAEIKKALASIDKQEWKQEQWQLQKKSLNEAMVKMEKVKEELKQQKFDKMIDMDKIQKDMAMQMEEAKEQTAKAKEELKNLGEFTDALEKDGLIDKNKAVDIEVKDGELYLNGIKQPKEISDKYRQYYKKPNFTIKNDPDAKKKVVI